MDLLSGLSNVLSGTAGAAIILAALKAFAAYEKSKGRGEKLPDYKNKFLDELGDMLRAHTEEIREVNSQLTKFTPIIMAVDGNNYPKVWSDHEQQRRTHENVNSLTESVPEIAKTLGEVHKKLAA